LKETTKISRDLYRGINVFKKGYHHRTNLVQDKNGDPLADSHNILNRWKNLSYILWNVREFPFKSYVSYILKST